jgi:hypothetical protein
VGFTASWLKSPLRTAIEGTGVLIGFPACCLNPSMPAAAQT